LLSLARFDENQLRISLSVKPVLEIIAANAEAVGVS